MGMRIDIDASRHEAQFELAAQLACAAKDDVVEICIGDVDVCPNRIVPIVGLADSFVSRGYDIRFVTVPHSAGERAVSGFCGRRLNPSGPVGEAFGRVWRFDTPEEQYALVDAMVLELDKSARLAAGVRQCLDWSINEVTDNVLNHSRPNGNAHGYVMTQFVKAENRLKVCVFDTGVGIMESFVGSKYAPRDSGEAIRLAIEKGVTNGKGQGNGLWGLHEMVKLGKYGKFHIRSAGAEYLYNPARGIESVRVARELDGFGGTTMVDFQVVCSESARLQDIFGADYRPVDVWQEAHEDAEGTIHVVVAELASGYGARESAARVRHVVENAIDGDRRFVRLDFGGVTTCSSSFIDELLGKLIVKYGIVTYANMFKVENLKGLPAALANIAVDQRYRDEVKVKDADEVKR